MVVGDQHSYRPGILGVDDFRFKCALTPVDQRDRAGEVVDSGFAAVVDFVLTVVEERNWCGQVELAGAEARGADRVGRIERLYSQRSYPSGRQVHLHPRRLTVGRRRHIGVVAGAFEGCILGLGVHRIAFFPPAVVVEQLGVARLLGESRVVPPVVQPVDRVKQLDRRRHRLGLAGQRLLGDIVCMIKYPGCRDGRVVLVATQAVGVGVIDIGHCIVADCLDRTVGQPRIAVDVEALHRDQRR